MNTRKSSAPWITRAPRLRVAPRAGVDSRRGNASSGGADRVSCGPPFDRAPNTNKPIKRLFGDYAHGPDVYCRRRNIGLERVVRRSCDPNCAAPVADAPAGTVGCSRFHLSPHAPD
jgi:hypothetical protein